MEVSPMRRLSAVLLVAVAVAGCKKSDPPAAPQAAGTPAGDMAAAGGPAAPAPASAVIKGKILEKLDAPPYSYLKIQNGKDEVWAAVPKTEMKKGEEASVAGAMPMNGFESKTLNRKFDVVYFGTLEGAAGAPAAAQQMPGQMGQGGEQMPPGGLAAQHANVAKTADVGNVKVDKAGGADARTVAEIHAQKATLKEKPVTVRGKVVKYNAGIMGKNWLHLRDGTGKDDKADNDITITTMDAAAVGDIVTVKGVVRTDKDFGAGYAYPVIVEDAKVAK
jgi:hypothetical protein